MKDRHQLELQIDEARKAMSAEEVLNHVIKLYGDEFDKANVEIAQQRSANDELFKLKQRVVIANRELMSKNEDANQRIAQQHEEIEKLRNVITALKYP